MPEIQAYIARAEVQSGNADEHLTSSEKIFILFNYPINNPVEFEFTHEGGFTVQDFVNSVLEGYTKIYSAEKDPGRAGNLCNRGESEGPYGIWGHDLGDLYLEIVTEKEPDHFEMFVGS